MERKMNIRQKAKIIAAYSPQGGAGKTTISVNTSIFCAMYGFKVLLVDLSTYGSVMSMLKIPQKVGYGIPYISTFLDLEKESVNSERFYEVVNDSIVKKVVHDNLDVLLSINPVRMESITESYIRIILNALRTLKYDFIIVDTTSDLNCRNLILIEEANYIIMPAIQDISCGWKILLFRELIEKLVLDKEKFGIVVNKCNNYSGFNNSEFEKEIGLKIIKEIPLYLKNYQNNINKGLLIHQKKNMKAYKCFDALAKQIINLTQSKQV